MKWRGRTWLQGPRAPRPGSVGQVAWSSETAIAFAGEKWVFLACFSVAEVSSVSTVAVQGASKGGVGFIWARKSSPCGVV